MLNVGRLVYTYADACAWAEEVADGLAYLHSYNPQIIHRDVKLDNVLLRRVPPPSPDRDVGARVTAAYLYYVEHPPRRACGQQARSQPRACKQNTVVMVSGA